MIEIRRADPAARRRAARLLAVVAIAGAVLLAAAERYRIPLRDWVLADPPAAADRAAIVIAGAAVVLLLPLAALAAWLWSAGGAVLRAGTFPPPGTRVLRDTPVVVGAAATARGRTLRVLAVVCLAAAAAIAIMFWRLAATLGERLPPG